MDKIPEDTEAAQLHNDILRDKETRKIAHPVRRD